MVAQLVGEVSDLHIPIHILPVLLPSLSQPWHTSDNENDCQTVDVIPWETWSSSLTTASDYFLHSSTACETAPVTQHCSLRSRTGVAASPETAEYTTHTQSGRTQKDAMAPGPVAPGKRRFQFTVSIRDVCACALLMVRRYFGAVAVAVSAVALRDNKNNRRTLYYIMQNRSQFVPNACEVLQRE
jgi:hypothetical protein